MAVLQLNLCSELLPLFNFFTVHLTHCMYYHIHRTTTRIVSTYSRATLIARLILLCSLHRIPISSFVSIHHSIT